MLQFPTDPGVGYVPSTVSLTAAHKGKLKNIRNAVLIKDNAPSVTVILNFEKWIYSCNQLQVQMKVCALTNAAIFRCQSLIIWLQCSTCWQCIILPWYCSAPHMDRYGQLGRLCVEHHPLASGYNYAMLMNPWMAEVFRIADFIKIDVTFKVLPELSDLFNVVTFD